MKRYLIAGAVGSAVFAAALGSASTLALNPGVAQTGAADLRGDSDGVVVQTYKYESDNNSSYGIRVGEIDGSLSGETMWAQIYDADNNRLARQSATITGSTVSMNWPTPVDFEDIHSVRLTIE